MPDGKVANCYAEDTAERSIVSKLYPNGFTHDYWFQERLEEPLKVAKPSGIFVGSMADVFGHWVKEERIKLVLEVCRKASQHIFQFLTKNPKRILDYKNIIPNNCWMGASSPPDFMWNKRLSQQQQEKMLHTTLQTFGKFPIRLTAWLSAEPLSWDIVPILEQYPHFIKWIVIGAASSGNRYFPPEETHVRRLVEFCSDLEIAVFFKGNLRSLKWASDHWREEFPHEYRERPSETTG